MNSINYSNYCGSCHLLPDPKNIPKDIWIKGVLPEMAARMGYRYDGYDPFAYKSPEEIAAMQQSGVYPDRALIDSVTWWNIHEYIISLAPNSIPLERRRKERNGKLIQFSMQSIDSPEAAVGIITDIEYDSISHLFINADAKGNLYQWSETGMDKIAEFNSAVTSYNRESNVFYRTEVGLLNPSEQSKGILSKNIDGVIDTIARHLHRPVFTVIVDLNEDGMDEFIICEFGNLTGQLSLIEQKGKSYHKKSLYHSAGATKVEITDMNGDGKKDIVALFAQGNEGIFIFYQEEDLTFVSQQVVQLPPEFGSSWFELIDYDRDGNLDIILTNGDNADYSIFYKPYHGIRLYVNDGDNTFEEKWFYPIYGASRVLAADYDLDGDIDFAVTALFNDTDHAPDDGFIYLENQDPYQFKFKSSTLNENFTNGWLTMEKGDYDGDGDIDIMLGSFNIERLRMRKSIFKSIVKDTVSLLLLQNTQKSN